MVRVILILFSAFFVFSCNGKKQNGSIETIPPDTKGLILSDLQMQLGNIHTDSVTMQVLGDELLLTGVLSINQNNITSISSRVMGRIENLYFKNIGDQVIIGQPLYDIYSEDLQLSIKEYKLATAKKKALDFKAVDVNAIISAAKNKLVLYGLSNKQIQEIESAEFVADVITIFSSVSGIITSIDNSEGSYIMQGESIYHISDLTELWADVQIYADNLDKVSKNLTATIFIPGISGFKTSGLISFVNPELNATSQINVLRLEIENKEGKLTPGMQINASILLNKINVLSLPNDAIIRDAKGASVWVQTGDKQFELIMIEPGIETDEFTEIRSGLKRGDIVVISGAYLLYSEYLFRMGTNPMEGHEGMTM